MLRGYQIDISETRLVLVSDDDLRLEPTALLIQQNLETQGMRTIGMEVWSSSDGYINKRPFVFGRAPVTTTRAITCRTPRVPRLSWCASQVRGPA